MNAKKISAFLLAAAMMVPCAAPAQTVLAEEAGAIETCGKPAFLHEELVFFGYGERSI